MFESVDWRTDGRTPARHLVSLWLRGAKNNRFSHDAAQLNLYSLRQSYQVYSGRRQPGSDKIRYYQSQGYGEKAAPAEGYIVTGAYSQGSYGAPSTGYHHSSAGARSVPRSSRKYEVGEFFFFFS